MRREQSREPMAFPLHIEMWADGCLQQTFFARNLLAAKFIRARWNKKKDTHRTKTGPYKWGVDGVWYAPKDWTVLLKFYRGDELVIKIRIVDSNQAGYLAYWWETEAGQKYDAKHTTKVIGEMMLWSHSPLYKRKMKKGPKGKLPF